MIKNKIKNWFANMINLNVNISDDVNVDIAKNNYKKYQDDLEQERKDYIKILCNQIKISSRNGSKSIVTFDLHHTFMSYEFMMELKEYFEQRGFNVEIERSRTGLITSWLRISW